MCTLRDTSTTRSLWHQAFCHYVRHASFESPLVGDEGFQFPILSDFLPHGEVVAAYGCSTLRSGAMRSTYVLDERLVTEIVATERLDAPRDFAE